MLVAINSIGAIASAATSAASSAVTRSASGAGMFSAGGAEQASAAPFADLMTDAVGQVSQLEDQANAAVSGLMTGTGVDVHQAMIATQKADMAFELALAVRNKAVQAYQR